MSDPLNGIEHMLARVHTAIDGDARIDEADREALEESVSAIAQVVAKAKAAVPRLMNHPMVVLDQEDPRYLMVGWKVEVEGGDRCFYLVIDSSASVNSDEYHLTVLQRGIDFNHEDHVLWSEAVQLPYGVRTPRPGYNRGAKVEP